MALEIRCLPSDDDRFSAAVASACSDLSELPTTALQIACQRRLATIRETYPAAEIRLGDLHGREDRIVFVFRDGTPRSSQAL